MGDKASSAEDSIGEPASTRSILVRYFSTDPEPSCRRFSPVLLARALLRLSRCDAICIICFGALTHSRGEAPRSGELSDNAY